MLASNKACRSAGSISSSSAAVQTFGSMIVIILRIDAFAGRLLTRRAGDDAGALLIEAELGDIEGFDAPGHSGFGGPSDCVD